MTRNEWIINKSDDQEVGGPLERNLVVRKIVPRIWVTPRRGLEPGLEFGSKDRNRWGWGRGNNESHLGLVNSASIMMK